MAEEQLPHRLLFHPQHLATPLVAVARRGDGGRGGEGGVANGLPPGPPVAIGGIATNSISERDLPKTPLVAALACITVRDCVGYFTIYGYAT